VAKKKTYQKKKKPRTPQPYKTIESKAGKYFHAAIQGGGTVRLDALSGPCDGMYCPTCAVTDDNASLEPGSFVRLKSTSHRFAVLAKVSNERLLIAKVVDIKHLKRLKPKRPK
jgi:hypothetical protein